MSAALWGFIGTVVGAGATFVATVWQQHVSHKRERESRRRDYQIQILTMLLDAAVNLIKWEDSVNKGRLHVGGKITSVKPSTRDRGRALRGDEAHYPRLRRRLVTEQG